jgi:WD40-like Beta Propeller Repeat
MPSVRPATPVHATLRGVASFAPMLLAACTGRTVALGEHAPSPYHFGTPQLVGELASNARTDNPTLTADLLEIYFTTDRGSGNGDVWYAKRSDPSLPFEAPSAIAEVNTVFFETSSAISADGLTLWFGSDRAGGVGSTDIWQSNRRSRSESWQTPFNVVALDTPVEDIPRPPGQHGLVMPLSSKQGTSVIYQTFLATRASTGAPFAKPVLISELAFSDRTTVDGFLTDDGLTLFYSSSPLVYPADAGPRPGDASANTLDGGPVPTADLFFAIRRSTSDPFDFWQPLDDLNTGGDERDPWLTPDGKTLYFTSDRDGSLNIYTAAVLPR